jgi:5-methylcytosine-specific restriction endonuclease McrA
MHAWLTNLKENNPIKYIQYCEKQRNHSLISHKAQSEKMKAKADERQWEELGKDAKRRRVFDQQKHKCNNCGLSEWRGQPIKLELEHKDGNHMNDERDNLEALCPNCHSLTDTWRGKNKEQSKQGKITDETLIAALKATETIRQALIFVGLSPRGGNYVRAKRLLQVVLPKQHVDE